MAPDRRVWFACLSAALSLAGAARADVVRQPVYSFQNTPGTADADFPTGIARDPAPGSAGALYGAASSNGGGLPYYGGNSPSYVFKLTPPPPGVVNGTWQKSVLWTAPDGPYGPLGLTVLWSATFDRSGALFATLLQAYYDGSILKLTPPAAKGGAWTPQIVYPPVPASGAYIPQSPLLVDGSGALFGINGAFSNQAVFRLAPSGSGSGAYTYTSLYDFPQEITGENLPLIFGAGGTLVGSDFGEGTQAVSTIYQLAPPGPGKTAWTYRSIYANAHAQGVYALAADPAGDVFSGESPADGMATDPYSIFRLSPPASPGGAWSKTVVALLPAAAFASSQPAIVALQYLAGGLLISTQQSIWRATPPVGGSGLWAVARLTSFQGNLDTGRVQALTADASGHLYGVEGCESCTDSTGGVYKLYPNDPAP